MTDWGMFSRFHRRFLFSFFFFGLCLQHEFMKKAEKKKSGITVVLVET